MLTWTQPNQHGQIEAAGGKGTYTITWVGSLGYTLTGVGHDGLPMLVLPPYGRLLETLDKARDLAEAIERVKAVEPEASGT